MSANQDEITVVLINQENDNTESICVSKSSTTLSELFDFASALFNLQEGSTANLISNGRVLYSSKHSASGSKTLMEVGLTNGDMVLVHRVVPAARTAGRGVGMSTGGITPAAGSAGGAGGGGGGGGGLDFSSLLASAGIAAPPSAPSTALTSSSTSSSSTTTAPSSRGLTFDLTRLANANTQQKVEWERMTLDDAMSRNPNPEHFIEILLDELKHPNLMKELNHHNPALAMKIKDAGIKVSSYVCAYFTCALNMWDEKEIRTHFFGRVKLHRFTKKGRKKRLGLIRVLWKGEFHGKSSDLRIEVSQKENVFSSKMPCS
uniref:Ubiquitin-like domain-containing protein n=1 Tax=Ditylum brightwellii TaxID=49249 RepID=A0A6V2E1T3_9STRA